MFSSTTARIAIAAISLAAVTGLSACGSDKNSTAASSTTTAAKTTTTATTPAATTTSAAPSTTQSAGSAKPAPGATGQAGVTFMLECSKANQVQQPVTYAVECAVQHKQLQELKWTGWGTEKATATGVWVEKDGATNPRLPITVTASKIEKREATMLYRALTVTFTDKAPDGMKKTAEYKLDW